METDRARCRGARRLDPLVERLIRGQLARRAGSWHDALELHGTVDSTNARLLDKARVGDIHRSALLAECQSLGRGRRGRTWYSPPDAGLYLSLGWHICPPRHKLSLLPLMVGVAVIRALHEFVPAQVRLKWPNDIVVGKDKLGGILLETVGRVPAVPAATTKLVVGIGLNVCLPRDARAHIDRPSQSHTVRPSQSHTVRLSQSHTDLACLVPIPPSRNALAAALIWHVCQLLEESAQAPYHGWLREWRAYDACSGKEAELLFAGTRLTGRVLGIDAQGRLLFASGRRLQRFPSGDLSLRVRS